MPRDDCTSCKPGNPTLHPAAVAATGCKELYEIVDECMKRNNGGVSACNEEWQAFRSCHAKERRVRQLSSA
ncbi:hypothetical protein Ae201684P_013004 [Aphanomyces euteiches]|uniref:COX assembly mitochondrial protein n=1 Tax=Aphanomyces euteiches TaxID=100861 RepID=A0A6G0WK36_9STRA|nr:hypothetical protein Ae201684_014423 [Aphanomyces euteiches]KAH9088790.1 hypothetical protein Ae201684P_013004 [Aphanomyces euteiches]